MSKLLSTQTAREIADLVLRSAGASAATASVVSDHLVTSESMGLASHGLLRISQYVSEIEAGEIDPTRWPAIEESSPVRARMSGARCFGQVAGVVASQWVAQACSVTDVCVLTARDVGHTGRIGAYAERIARSGAIGIAFCSGPPSGQRVAPFGALDGRLATNPIAYAFPTTSNPVTADFSTSVVPEGKVRAAKIRGANVVAGALQDADGKPTTDPGVLYGSPPGTLLPLGGPDVGYKGTALAILVEVMATLLSGDTVTDATRVGNNLCLLGVSLPPEFPAAASELVAHLKSARPTKSVTAVLVPGELEELRAVGTPHLSIDDETWSTIVQVASRYGVDEQLNAIAGTTATSNGPAKQRGS